MRILLKSTGGSLRLGDETGMIVGYVSGNGRALEVMYDARIRRIRHATRGRRREEVTVKKGSRY